MTATLKAPVDSSVNPVDPRRFPLLAAIDSPADLRKLNVDTLPRVCTEIRDFLINSLSTNPGHFASSMGVVELTVALHYVFNTPYDRIVWDVGHQAYGHKLLTGRASRFHTNRKLGGLSGFPSPSESEYDTFTAGHASNSISAALGMAVAAALKHDEPRRNVVAVIGDASISGGLAFEGINNAANSRNNLLIILNDNDMSIDPNVGSLNTYLAHINTSRAYNNFRLKTYNFLRKIRFISEHTRDRILRFNNSLKSLLSRQQNIFEGLNIRYFGPFDGHDLPKLIKVLEEIKDMEGPRILHLRTVKGKGYEPAERNPAQWHAPGKFNPSNGERLSDNATAPKYQDVFGNTLVELANTNPRIVAITAAMLSGTSVAMMQKTHPDRTFDVGISEGHAVTFAGGLAKDGMIPFVAIYSSFLQRAVDQIIHDVALPELPVVFAIDRAGIVGEDGATHHGMYDLAYLSEIPGMTIAAPADAATLRDLMYTAQLPDRNGPIAIRYPRGRCDTPNWRTPMKAIEIGRGRKLTDGRQVSVLSLGTISSQVAKAIRRADESGISVAHYDMIFLKPIDTAILEEVAESGTPIITVEDASEKGGLGSAVLEWLADHGYKRQVYRLGVPDSFVPHGTVAELQRLCGLDSDAIYETIVKSVNTTTL